MASSCFLHSPFLPSRPSSSSSSSNLVLSSHSQPFVIILRNAGLKRKIRAPLVASINTQTPPDSFFSNRRVLIFLGFSILPLLKWKNRALPVMAAGGDIQKTQEGTDEHGLESARPPNPFLSLINVIGTLGSGIFGALYALARRDKIALEEKIESLTNELKEKDAAIVAMAKDFESKLVQQQEEGKKQLNAAKEKQLSLINQLNSANGTISGIERTLQGEKANTKELQYHFNSLQARFSNIEEDKLSLEGKLKEKNDSVSLLQENVKLLGSELKGKEEAIWNLNSLLASRDVDLENLGAERDRARNELARTQLEKSGLVEDLVKVKTALNQKVEMVNGLNSRLRTLEAERDELRTGYNALSKEYEELKASSVKKATSDAVLLEESERERSRLEENYKLATVRSTEYEAVVSNLVRERDELKRNLDLEAMNMNGLKKELHVKQEALDRSRDEASDLAQQLTLSRGLCSKLESEVARAQAELSSQLSSAKEAQNRTDEELKGKTQELAAISEHRDSLEKELIKLYQKAETATRALQEDKNAIASLNAQLRSLEKQTTKDKESRRILETDLDEATKALDVMNKQTLLFSRELENASTQINDIRDEKERLRKVTDEHKKASIEAGENLDDAQKVIMRLGSERGSLEVKVRELEKELASSKGELLRLKTNQEPKPGVEEANEPIIGAHVKKNARRRRGSS